MIPPPTVKAADVPHVHSAPFPNKTENGIPLLNLETLEREIPTSLQARQQFKEILKDFGLFYLSDHGIHPNTVQEFIDVTEEFFKKPEDSLEKTDYKSTHIKLRGFTPFKPLIVSARQFI